MFNTSLESFYLDREGFDNYGGLGISNESIVEHGLEDVYPDLNDNENDGDMSFGMEAVSCLAEADQFGFMALVGIESLDQEYSYEADDSEADDSSDKKKDNKFVGGVKKVWEFIKKAFLKIITSLGNFIKQVANFFRGIGAEKQNKLYADSAKDGLDSKAAASDKTIKNYEVDSSNITSAGKLLEDTTNKAIAASENASKMLSDGGFKDKKPEELAQMVSDLTKSKGDGSIFSATYFTEKSVRTRIYGTDKPEKKEVKVKVIVANAGHLLTPAALTEGKNINKTASKFSKNVNKVLKVVKKIEKNIGDDPKYSSSQKYAIDTLKKIQSASSNVTREMLVYFQILMTERSHCVKAIKMVMGKSSKSDDSSDDK